MATKYYAVLTNVGAAKLANATALGAQVEITQMAVGDGNGVLPTPNPAQTALVHELRRKPLNSLSIDPNNANQIIAEQVIPEDEGGWWIREIGLFDKDGDMIAVANCAETYKPQLQEGSGRVQVVRMILIVSSTAAVTLKIDPSVVLATRQYVDDQIIQVKSYVDQKMAAHVAAADPHKQYAPKESPALTGRPTAPTAEGKDSSTQIANTAFVQAAIAALVGSSPEALDTLNELAAALGNDPNFATTVTNSLAGKMDKSANGSDIENVSVFLQNLGIPTALALLAPLDSPSLTGTPTVPNATQDQLDFRIANTAFVGQAIAELKGGVPAALNTLKKIADALALKAPLDSPDLTGTPTTTTANINQLDKRLASTEFVSLFVTHNNNQLFPVRTMTGNDSIRIPDIDGGIIFQWLTLSASAFPAFDTDVPVTLPRAFPNQHLIALAVSVNASASTTSDGLPQISGRDRGSVTVKQAITVQTQTLSDVAILCIGF